MYFSELTHLFTPEELRRFLMFMRNFDSETCLNSRTGKVEEFFHIYDIQVFISTVIYGTKRYADVMNTCIANYPQLIGMKKSI